MSKIPNGLVLSGGKSSRMGSDKGLIVYHGKPQRNYLLDLLKPFCNQVYISSPRNSTFSQSIILDNFKMEGPLNGILSAFHFDPDAAWLTVPIDMPNIDSNAIEYLLKNRNPQKLATCFLNSNRISPEPLFTLWEAKSKPVVFNFFNSGGTSIRKFLAENDVLKLTPPDSRLLKNINTQEELTSFFKESAKNIQ